MRSTALALAAALVVALATATVAFATTVLDRDDVTTGLDIAKVTSTHNRSTDQLVQTIDFYDPLALKNMVAADGKPPSSICVEIWTRSTPGQSSPDYEACAGPSGKAKGWVASIARKRLQGPQLRIGAVKVEQPSPTRLVMRINPDDIKRPASYRWRVETTDFGSACTTSSGCPDYAPDRPATAVTKLSKPRS